MTKKFKEKNLADKSEEKKEESNFETENIKEEPHTKQEGEENIEEKHEKPIIIRAEAYKTIILYASRYANQAIPSPEWKEIYGILTGYTDDDFVYVESAEALTYGHSTDVQLDTRHYIFIDEIQQRLDEEGKGHFMVGWWHSHPGLNLFFSYVDLMNQLGFQQNNPDFCGLVFDHSLLGKKKEERIGNNILTKYDTGFEIYRLTDANMDINSVEFSDNYHTIDYIVEGLNKFFFANLLTELSALYAKGKPLQSAYGEGVKSKYQEPSEIIEQKEKDKHVERAEIVAPQEILDNIPISEDVAFDVDDFFTDEIKQKQAKILNSKENAEQLIYEGNQAFKNRDAFTGIEKYRLGIEKYKELNEFNRVFELLGHLSEHCISTEHQNLAEEFADELYDLASDYGNLFYKAEASYLQGYLLLSKVNNDTLEIALKQIQNASINYEEANDYAGAGRAYYKIGTIYQSRLNQAYNSALFYVQAIMNYNTALIQTHPLRKSLWSRSESLIQKILELKDIVNDLIPNIENSDESDKILGDLSSIQYNF